MFNKNKKKIIAIIPARSGSKAIKDKNIKYLGTKPLLGWAVHLCIKSKLFSKVYVSTDSKKYARIAQKFGLVEIILRPKKISLTRSTDYEMISHAMKKININYDYIAHIRPTSPLRTLKQIKKAIDDFTKSNYSSLRSVHENSETAYKTVEIKNSILKPLKNLKLSLDQINAPRQGFEKTYSPNGIIDIYRKKFILKNKLLFGKKSKAFITPLSQEIDTIDDFKYLKNVWKK
jgi:CMP-N,N'-diacetyllegionaminic acid synthase